MIDVILIGAAYWFENLLHCETFLIFSQHNFSKKKKETLELINVSA